MRRINVLLALSILLFNASCSEEEDIVAPVVESEPEIEYDQPVADFSLNVYSTSQVETPDGIFIVAPAEIWVTNESEHSTSYKWSFGDDGESSDTAPEYTFKEAGTYEITLLVEGDGGQDQITKTIEVIEISDLMVGVYIYEALVITSSGQEETIYGEMKISEFGDEFKLNFDDGEEVVYTDGWQRGSLDRIEFNVDDVNRFDYHLTGYRSEGHEFHATFSPWENGLFLSLDIDITDDSSEDFTMFFVAYKQ